MENWGMHEELMTGSWGQLVSLSGWLNVLNTAEEEEETEHFFFRNMSFTHFQP